LRIVKGEGVMAVHKWIYGGGARVAWKRIVQMIAIKGMILGKCSIRTSTMAVFGLMSLGGFKNLGLQCNSISTIHLGQGRISQTSAGEGMEMVRKEGVVTWCEAGHGRGIVPPSGD